MTEYMKDLRAMSVAELREELTFWAWEIEYALSEDHRRWYDRMYDRVWDFIEEKEGWDWAKRWPECMCDGDRVVRQWSAKPFRAVRFRPITPKNIKKSLDTSQQFGIVLPE